MATNPNGPHNNYVGASFDWKANGTTGSHYNCPFCAVPYQMSQPYPCGFNGAVGKVKAICSKTNGPHNNVVGASYIPPATRECPFCHETKVTGSNWACGMTGCQYKVTSICGRLAMLCGPVAAASNGPKLLDPKENRIGNTVGPWKYGNPCPFCGGPAKGAIQYGGCGWAGNMKPNDLVLMTSVCEKVNVAKPAQVVAGKKIEWIKPTINCPACGAYCAHKHRIGCKAVVTC